MHESSSFNFGKGCHVLLRCAVIGSCAILFAEGFQKALGQDWLVEPDARLQGPFDGAGADRVPGTPDDYDGTQNSPDLRGPDRQPGTDDDLHLYLWGTAAGQGGCFSNNVPNCVGSVGAKSAEWSLSQVVDLAACLVTSTLINTSDGEPACPGRGCIIEWSSPDLPQLEAAVRAALPIEPFESITATDGPGPGAQCRPVRTSYRSGWNPQTKAQPAVVLGPPPDLHITDVSIGSGLELFLSWVGGSGPYTVQTTPSLQGPWTTRAARDAQHAVLPLTAQQGFVRILDGIAATALLDAENVAATHLPSSGQGTADLLLVGNTLSGLIVFHDLTSPLTNAALYGPASPFIQGGVILDLNSAVALDPGNKSGRISVRSIIPGWAATALSHGATYVELATMENPSGEIRGQLQPAVGRSTSAALDNGFPNGLKGRLTDLTATEAARKVLVAAVWHASKWIKPHSASTIGVHSAFRKALSSATASRPAEASGELSDALQLMDGDPPPGLETSWKALSDAANAAMTLLELRDVPVIFDCEEDRSGGALRITSDQSVPHSLRFFDQASIEFKSPFSKLGNAAWLPGEEPGDPIRLPGGSRLRSSCTNVVDREITETDEDDPSKCETYAGLDVSFSVVTQGSDCRKLSFVQLVRREVHRRWRLNGQDGDILLEEQSHGWEIDVTPRASQDINATREWKKKNPVYQVTDELILETGSSMNDTPGTDHKLPSLPPEPGVENDRLEGIWEFKTFLVCCDPFRVLAKIEWGFTLTRYPNNSPPSDPQLGPRSVDDTAPETDEIYQQLIGTWHNDPLRNCDPGRN